MNADSHPNFQTSYGLLALLLFRPVIAVNSLRL
jgi:hypothetical protein